MPHPFLGLGFNSWAQKFSRGNVPAAVAAFLEYVTTSNTSSFTLLSTGTVDYEVDWGDGTTESLTTNNPTHTYSSAGEYTIRVTPAEGSTYRPLFNNAVSDTSIASVSGTGGSQLGTNLSDAWEGASNMTSFSGDIDISSVTNFTRTWTNTGLTSFPLFDFSSATTLSSAWKNCTSLTTFPLIIIGSTTKGSTYLQQTWQGCNSLTSFPLIDTSGVTSFSQTWYNCTGLTSFPQLDSSSVTYFGFAWLACSGLTSFPLINTSSGTTFSYAWSNCVRLTSFPLINTSSGTNFSNAWSNCSGLTSFPLINTSSGTNFSSTWKGCSGLTSFPLLDFSSGYNFGNTWQNCTSLTTFPANVFDTTGSIYSSSFTNSFNNCALSAQSIENILTSLDTNGASNITLGIDSGTNAAKTTWSAAANTAYNNLITKGWTIAYNA